ncbi:hypothetical protein BH23BAC3_BH23BAC3_30920 [soil metagenome]
MKEQSENNASSQFLKTDGRKTEYNAIELAITLPNAVLQVGEFTETAYLGDIIGFYDADKTYEDDRCSPRATTSANVILVSNRASNHLESLAMKIRNGTQSKRS